MANDLNRSIKIYIDGSEATNNIAKIEESIQKLEKELSSLDKSESNYEERSQKLKKELESKNRAVTNYRKSVAETERVLKNLSGATYNELIAAQRRVRNDLRQSIPGTQAHTAALEQNRRVTEALARAQAAMRVEVGCQGSFFGKAANFMNKYIGLVSATLAGITGLTMSIRKSITDYAKMEEAMAGVKKYTGMTSEEVKGLNEELKKMDTRTSREKLNALAGDAGRLGITGKKQILEFVDAADKINVALGEDLGEDAVKNIGKLAQMFGEDKRMGLRGAMLATASAVNEVAQNSSAAEPYLVEFTARVAGVAQQAGITQANIIGLAASMDENMLRNETSATAFQKILMKMLTDTENFARSAGLNVQEFKELVQRDANEAMLTFAAALGKKGGLVDLAPIFGDLKTEGAGVASVLSVLAGKAEEVRQRQQLANQAYTEGTSVLNEYNVQNNTVQAGLDKAKKGFLEISIQLGEKLKPLMSGMISGSGLLVRGLAALVDILIKYRGVLVSLTAAVTAYVAVLKAKAAWTKITTFWNDNLIKSVKALFVVLKRHPLGLIAAAAGAVIPLLYKLMKGTSDVSDAMRRMNGELMEEQRSLGSLFEALKRTAPQSEARKKIIQEINEKYGKYLPNLLSEKSGLDEINEAYKRINSSLTEQIALKYKNEEIKTLMEGEDGEDGYAKKQIDAIEEIRKSFKKSLGNGNLANIAIEELKRITAEFQTAGSSWEKAFGQAYHSIKNKYFGDKSLGKGAASSMETYIKSWYAMQKDIQKVESKYENWMPKNAPNEIPEVVVTAGKTKNGVPGDGSTVTNGGDDKIKSRLEKEKTLYTKQQTELLLLYTSGKDKELLTERQYNDRLLLLKKEHLKRIVTLAGKGSSEAADAEKQLAEIGLQERKAAVEHSLAVEKALYEQQQRELKEQFIEQNTDGLKTMEDYEAAKEHIAIMHLERSLEIAGLDAENRKSIEEQLLDFKLKCVEEELKERQKAADKEAKIEKEKNQKIEEETRKKEQNAQKRYTDMMGYANSFGEAIGRVIAGQENALAAFGDTMVDIVFDVLTQMIDAELIRLQGIGLSTIAETTAKQIATKGFAGIASGAALAAVISAGIAAARTGLKALLGSGRRPSDGSAGNSQESYSRVAVPQHAAGRYDVIGNDDRRPYKDVPYIGDAPTGIVSRPALISENGAELIINAEDLARLKRHINYPLVVDAINDSRRGITQHASGNYQAIADAPSPSSYAPTLSPQLIGRLTEAVERMLDTPIEAYVSLTEFERKQRLRHRSRKIGSKKTN